MTGADGSLIISGEITASRLPSLYVPKLGRTSAHTAIQPDGSFELPRLTLGAYQLCVTVPGTAWLDSCEWGRSGTVVALTPIDTSAQATISLTKGALVTVRVNDPLQLLPKNEGVAPGASLFLGVGGDSHFFRTAAIASQDSGGRSYQILIPFGRSVNISVTSSLFQLTDQKGGTLPPGNLFPVTVPPGQIPATLVLNLIGIVAVAAPSVP